jgi:predicted ATPase
MLETVREYARERLGERGEADAVARRHAEFFLALAEEACPQLSAERAAECRPTRRGARQPAGGARVAARA